MRFSTFAAVVFSAAAVSAHGHNGTQHTNGTDFTTTEIVTAYTTYCPYATTIVENNKTYTVTEATTLTISNCPCTRTKTYTTVTSTACPGGCVPPTSHAVLPSGTGSGAGPTHYPNGTSKPTNQQPKNSAPGTKNTTSPTSSPPAFEGSANRATVAAGALAGLIGVAAYLL